MPPTSSESFGTILRRCRKQTSLSQETQALKSRLSPRTISDHVECLRVSGHIALLKQDVMQAQHDLDQALYLCHEHGFAYLRAKTLVIYGDLHLQLGEKEKAIEVWKSALQTFHRLEERYFALFAEDRLRLYSTTDHVAFAHVGDDDKAC